MWMFIDRKKMLIYAYQTVNNVYRHLVQQSRAAGDRMGDPPLPLCYSYGNTFSISRMYYFYKKEKSFNLNTY